MSDWKEYKLGDIADVVSERVSISKATLDNYISTENMINDFGGVTKTEKLPIATSANSFNQNDILFSNIRTYFKKVWLSKFNGTVSPDVLVFRARENKCISAHLYYSLCNPDFTEYSVLTSKGAKMPRGDKDALLNFIISLPSLPEQTAIASVLSSLDDKIDLLHRQNATLEKMAETLFRQWFVEPIKKIVNKGDEIEGFSNDKFSKWISETVGGEWGKENAEGDFNKVVYCIRGTDIADLNTGLPMKTPLRFVKENKFKNIELNEGDLIIEISGGTENQSTGRVCYINQDIKNLFEYPLVFSNFCRMIRVKKPEYSFFLYCYIQYLYNQDEFFNLENGSSGIKNLDYKALIFELEYPMPNEKLVLEFHNQVKAYYKKVNRNKTQIRTLTALRDTLLPKLMSGEVRVS